MSRKQMRIIFIVIPITLIASILIYFIVNMNSPSKDKPIYFIENLIDNWENASFLYDAKTNDLLGIKILHTKNPWGLFVSKEKHPLVYDFYDDKQAMLYEYNREQIDIIIQKDHQLGYQTSCYFEIILKYDNLFIHSIYEIEDFQGDISNKSDHIEKSKQIDLLCKEMIDSYSNYKNRIQEVYP